MRQFKFSIHKISLLVCLVVSSSLFAQEETPQQVLDRQAAAAGLEKSGDWAGALAEYERIIRGYPNTDYGLDACANSAGLYVKQRQFENLQPVIVQICTNFKDQPGVFRVLSKLAEDFMYAKAYPAALSLCIEAQAQLASNPRVILVIGWLGMIYAHQGDFEGAGQMREALLQKTDCMPRIFWMQWAASAGDITVQATGKKR